LKRSKAKHSFGIPGLSTKYEGHDYSVTSNAQRACSLDTVVFSTRYMNMLDVYYICFVCLVGGYDCYDLIIAMTYYDWCLWALIRYDRL